MTDVDVAVNLTFGGVEYGFSIYGETEQDKREVLDRLRRVMIDFRRTLYEDVAVKLPLGLFDLEGISVCGEREAKEPE